jgi:uncharacterized protein (TIGR03083 family)
MADRLAELRADIAAAHDELLQLLDRMSPEDYSRATSNEGWTTRDLMAHLATINQRLRDQVKTAKTGGQYSATEDVNVYNERQVAERRNWNLQQVRKELEDDHAATLAAIDGLTEADLEKGFQHPTRGWRTIELSLTGIATHFGTHTGEIAAALPARA